MLQYVRKFDEILLEHVTIQVYMIIFQIVWTNSQQQPEC